MPEAQNRAARFGDDWYGPMVKPDEAIGFLCDTQMRRAELGRSTPQTFQARVSGEPSLHELRPYIDAGFDALVGPCETFQGERGFEMTGAGSRHGLACVARRADRELGRGRVPDLGVDCDQHALHDSGHGSSYHRLPARRQLRGFVQR